ncbi:MAG: hypothetical protein H0Z28_09540 [Archaeoglobus sp.]|nr:hypothetical protein [Archaeoglobus sp.]
MISMRTSLPLTFILLLLFITTVSALDVDITPREQSINIGDVGIYDVTLHLEEKDCCKQVLILRFTGVEGADSSHVDGELVGDGLSFNYSFSGHVSHYKVYLYNPPGDCPGDKKLTLRVWFADGVQNGEKFKITMGDITQKFAIACAKVFAIAVPELATMALVGAGVVAVVLLRRFG